MSLGSPLQRPGVPTPPGSRTDSSPLSRCSSSGPVQSPVQGNYTNGVNLKVNKKNWPIP